MRKVVELVYDDACPNVAEARAQLLRAFVAAGQQPRWAEHRIGDPALPAHARGHGSPTILVDGRDVSAAAPSSAATCRLYRDVSGAIARVPSVFEIAEALAGAPSPVAARSPKRWKSSLAVLPAIGAALLPKVACPACWPAYGGILSILGLGFLLDATWLLPATATFLAVALAALAFRARTRRGYLPLCVGSVGAVVVLAGKFVFDREAAMYAGIGLLVAASIWNSWPRPQRPSCSACAG